jgi:hypothetical protein
MAGTPKWGSVTGLQAESKIRLHPKPLAAESEPPAADFFVRKKVCSGSVGVNGAAIESGFEAGAVSKLDKRVERIRTAIEALRDTGWMEARQTDSRCDRRDEIGSKNYY